jgi:uncharacterized lipoprotein YddW (UPF0748 family)
VFRSAIAGVVLLCALTAHAQPSPPASRAEYRAFWVETFHTPLGTHDAVDRVIAAAVRANANAIFAQVRRRGDAWYLDAREPLTETDGVGEPDPTGRPTFDPLRYLIDEAHARGIEVHAFVIVGSIFAGDPRKAMPRDPTHPFVQHIANIDASSPAQWATRALPPRNSGTTFDGQRFGTEWYIDLGHPEAAAYTVNVLAHLVRKYDLDGLHLDRIRYPEAPSAPRGGINVGYNATNVARFRARVGDTAGYDDAGFPLPNDPQWNDWRREQVTAFLRRLYLTVKSIRPSVKVSAAAICYGTGPTANGGFQHTEAYERVFQDWRGWAEEGIIDILAPMNYKRERLVAQAKQFDDWLRFTADTARENGRISLIGVGAFMNPLDATLRQTRRALARSDGVIFYSLASTNSVRSDATDFFSAVGTRAFRTPASTPQLVEHGGYVMGLVRDSEAHAVDGAEVTISDLTTGTARKIIADGNGFYGAPHLTPGRYRVTARFNGEQLATSLISIEVGHVTNANLDQYTIRKAFSAPGGTSSISTNSTP